MSSPSRFSDLLGPEVFTFSAEMPVIREAMSLPKAIATAADSRRDEFQAGRYCAQRALELGGLTVSGDAIGIAEDRSPIWPQGWVGSITHTSGFIAAAVAPTGIRRGIGIDVEQAMRVERASEVRRKIFSPGEWETLSQTPQGLSEGEFVTLVFSAKESLYKCLRPLTGQFFGFQSARVVEVDAESGFFRVELIEDVGGGFKPGWSARGRFMIQTHKVFTAVELKA